MKPEAQDQLDQTIIDMIVSLLHKDPNDLTEADIAFLNARVYYIKQKHIDAMPQVFGTQKKNRTRRSADPAAKVAPAAATEPAQPQAGAPNPYTQTDTEDEELDGDDLDDSDLDDDAEG